MNSPNLLRHPPPIQPDALKHLFAVGQPVRIKRGFGLRSEAARIYHITATLPPSGESLQYRIRNDDERYERVAIQDNLEPVRVSSGKGTTLLERTFGHG